jgi:hypothetical protein
MSITFFSLKFLEKKLPITCYVLTNTYEERDSTLFSVLANLVN